MSHRRAWRAELVVVGSVAVLLALPAILIDQLLTTLLSALFLYLCWHIYQLYRFSLWLENPKRNARPYAVGIWQTLIDRVDLLHARARKRKRKLSKMLSGLLESTGALPDATLVLNEKGGAEWWNSVAAEVLGLKRKRDKGVSIDKLVHDPVFHSYLSKGDYGLPLQIPSPVNERTSLEVRVVPYGKGKRLLQARDITRLNQLEIMRRDFVANVSHEIRTPLTVVHGYIETMQDCQDEAFAQWKGIFQQMAQQTNRIQHIVEDLLLLARLESGSGPSRESVVSMKALVDTIVDGARQLSGEKAHRFTLNVDDQLMLVGHGPELESAFSNLVYNAVRYTPENGEITISWVQTDSGPCFSVTDTGIGIAPEHIPRLTERFYRVDVGRSRQSGGTGLGLAIVKHVLSHHETLLKVESTPGEGSTFSCCFPNSRSTS
ncbi:MAG: phosphate regulon sensor histidine kinase PhoR [Candidatus Sedimenticola sp. (ex Thyasira tokunagai)]